MASLDFGDIGQSVIKIVAKGLELEPDRATTQHQPVVERIAREIEANRRFVMNKNVLVTKPVLIYIKFVIV
jgi:hypothetical protein